MLGNVSTMAVVASIVAGIIFAVSIIIYFCMNNPDDYSRPDGEEIAKHRKFTYKTLYIFVFCVLVAIFTPSTKSLCLIYGIGGTIDYIKSNDTAKQLPDKVVNALDRWLDSQTGDDNGNKQN